MNITYTPVLAPAIRAEGAGFACVGRGRVTVEFGRPGMRNVSRYQYRQYIKGSCTLQRGNFSGTPHSRENWVAIELPQSGNNLFAIPGGGLQAGFTEDGEVSNGTAFYFGYRTNPAVSREGLEDYYIPNQQTGDRYVNLDTFGIRGPSRPSGLRIIFDITWEGRIVDTSRGNLPVMVKSWNSAVDQIIP